MTTAKRTPPHVIVWQAHPHQLLVDPLATADKWKRGCVMLIGCVCFWQDSHYCKSALFSREPAVTSAPWGQCSCARCMSVTQMLACMGVLKMHLLDPPACNATYVVLAILGPCNISDEDVMFPLISAKHSVPLSPGTRSCCFLWLCIMRRAGEMRRFKKITWAAYRVK